MSESLHTTAAPAEIAIYPENIAAFAGARTAPVADRPATPALAGLIEVERRLGELAGKLEQRHPTRPLPHHAEEVLLLHDSVDELRQVVAVIAGALGLL